MRLLILIYFVPLIALLNQPVKKEVPGIKEITTEVTTTTTTEVKEVTTEDLAKTQNSLVEKYFGDKKEEALRVIYCESKGDPKATHLNRNGSRDRGLYQINSIHLDSDDLYDPETNIKVAKEIYDRTGSWKAWYSSKSCHKLN